jgi:RecJ-like exonuclease
VVDRMQDDGCRNDSVSSAGSETEAIRAGMLVNTMVDAGETDAFWDDEHEEDEDEEEVDCPECGGTGEVEEEDGEWHSCDWCGGTGVE